MSSLARQLEGYRLVTAQIVYRLPDHPALLQEFIWQELDLAPKFPVLNKFLPSGRPTSTAKSTLCGSPTPPSSPPAISAT